MHTLIHMHAHAHPLRARRGLVLSYLKNLWSSFSFVPPLHVLASHSSVTERNDNALPVFCLPRLHRYTLCRQWMMDDVTPGSFNCDLHCYLFLLRAFLMRVVKTLSPLTKPSTGMNFKSRASFIHHSFKSLNKNVMYKSEATSAGYKKLFVVFRGFGVLG